MSENPNITNNAIRDQWNRLVIQPISQHDSNAISWPTLIVLDALDECEHDSEIKTILRILSEIHNGPASDRVRVFLTSRPDLPIRPGFRRMPSTLHCDLVLHRVSRETVDRDIRKFIKHEFKEIVLASDHLPDGWPGEVKIEQLVKKADGLFVFASTMCKYIANEHWSPQELLQVILSPPAAALSEKELATPPSQPTLELDQMYTQVLERPFRKLPIQADTHSLLKTLRLVLGAIAIAAEPLSINAIAALLSIRREVVETRLQHLHAVLDVPRDILAAVRISHPSFREFLLDKTRCRSQHFWLDKMQVHRTLADGCVQAMSALKLDICFQNSSKIHVYDVEVKRLLSWIPEALQYACRHLDHHVEKSEERLFDNCKIHQLLLEHFLHWLEMLSWMRRTSDGILAIRRLASSIEVS